MNFDFAYLGRVRVRLEKLPPDWVKDYQIDVEDYTLPPLLDIVQYLTEFAENGGRFSAHSKEQIVRTAIFQKAVKVKYRGEELQGFTMNTPNELFDAHETLKKHPAVLMLLQQTAVARMLEKSLPLPVESRVQPVAAGTRPLHELSKERPGAA